MAEFSIPVDLFNPGQVFACLGFLEAADMLCGDAEGGFDWSDGANAKFCLQTVGNGNPFEAVLEFLAEAEVKAVAPRNWRPKDDPAKEEEPKNDKDKKKWERAKRKLEEELSQQEKTDTFPDALPDTSSAMPIQIANSSKQVVLGHWADGSNRKDFKLYSGYRSALDIATAMISGTFNKPRKGQESGDLKTKGIFQLWEECQSDLSKRPFEVLTPMGGSFNFDPRGGWIAIDAGYSPNDQKHQVEASPVVEILAAWGLENARPDEYKIRKVCKVCYAVWGVALPPMLARVALCGGITTVPIKRFRFELHLSGRNKVVTFVEQEITHD